MVENFSFFFCRNFDKISVLAINDTKEGNEMSMENFWQISVKIVEKLAPSEISTIFLNFFDWSTWVNMLQWNATICHYSESLIKIQNVTVCYYSESLIKIPFSLLLGRQKLQLRCGEPLGQVCPLLNMLHQTYLY